MKCVIPGVNVKVFGRAVHSLSKIGEELYIEPLETGLALKTVNSSRSAYGCFVFAPNFFQHYDDGAATVDSQDFDEDGLRCKVGVKACLNVFKSLSTLERTVDRCKIAMKMNEARLIFQLYCKHGIVKTYNLAFIECETLQAVFSKDLSPNILTAQSRLLCDIVVNFQYNQEEVTLSVNSERVSLKNYVEDEPDPNKVVHTELVLNPDEFDGYQVGVDTDITFCLKELRSILAFSEMAGLPVTLHFEDAGKPIVFSIDSDPTFEGNFVLATLADKSNDSEISGTQKSTQPTNKIHSVNKPRDKENPRKNYMRKKMSNDNSRNLTKDRDTSRSKAVSKPHVDTTVQDFMDESDDMDLQAEVDRMEATMSQQVGVGGGDGVRTGPHYSQMSIQPDAAGESASPVIPVISEKKESYKRFNLKTLAEDSDDDSDDMIPGTPPSKKYKSLFFGLSQSTVGTQQNAGRVLCEDSDPD